MASQMSAKSLRARELREEAGKVVTQLHLVSKLQALYDGENKYVREGFEALHALCTKILTLDDELVLAVEDGYMLANGIRLRTERAAVEAHEWLLTRIAESGIDKLTIRAGVKPIELRKLLPILAKATWADGNPYPPAIVDELDRELVTNIAVKMRRQRAVISEEEESEVSSQKLAMLLWFQLHTAACDLVAAAKSGASLPMRRARALMKPVVDLFLEEGAGLVSMTRLKYYTREGSATGSAWEAYLESHMVNTALLSLGLGISVGLAKRQLLDLGAAALAADVGMALVPLELRDRAGPLLPEDREEVDRHALVSADAILRSDESKAFAQVAAVVAAEHHAHLAKRLAPEGASFYAAIVSIADTYDAMTTDRPWRGAWPHTDALPQIVIDEQAYDPILAKAFANMLGVFPSGTIVELDTAELATVVGMADQNRHPARPIVKLIMSAGGAPIDSEPVDLNLKSRHGGYARSIVKLVNLGSESSGPGDLVALL